MTNKVKILITLLILIVLTIITYTFINKNNFDNIYNSTVYIETEDTTGSSIATGIVYKVKDNYAYIITCYHAINEANKINIYNINNDYEEASIYKIYEENDIALLKVKNTLKLHESKFANSDKVKLKDTIYVLGTPLNSNYSYTLTHGIVSYENRVLSFNSNKYNTIQIDAPVSGGNSGGPLLNDKGEVIGMIFLKETNSEGISFAHPINDILKVIK